MTGNGRRSDALKKILLSLPLLSCAFLPPQARAGATQIVTGVETTAMPVTGAAGMSNGVSVLVSPVTTLSAPGLSSKLSVLTPAPAAVSAQTALPLPASDITLAAPAMISPVVQPQAPAPAAPAATVAKMSEAVSAQVQIIQKPESGAETSSSSGQKVEDIITGRRSASGSGDVSMAVLAAPSDIAPSSQLQPASAASASAKPSVQPAAPAQVQKTTDSRLAYGAKRRLLAAIASVFGITASLPVAGPQIEQAVLSEAAHKRVVFSDFDDTLGKYNSVLTPEMAAAISAVRKAGKQVAVITDRTDTAGGTQKSAFESLAPIPVSERAGMYVAAVSGGRVYRYDSEGVPQKVWEYPPLEGERRQAVKDASDALKARLAELGAAQHPGDQRNPSESWQPYSYSLMLAIGTPEAVVKKAAKAFQEELKKRGIDAEVLPRVPKDPTNPAYLLYNVVNKSASVGYISKALGVEPWEAIAIGDNMYMPRNKEAEQPGRLTGAALGLAERLSGRSVPLTGNETDRNMERPLPGLLALSVGGTADPRMKNAFVLSGHGADASLQVLRAMASHPADARDPLRYLKTAGAALALLMVLGVIYAGWYSFYHAFFEAASKMFVPGGPDIGDLF
jgi:hypothetical protein